MGDDYPSEDYSFLCPKCGPLREDEKNKDSEGHLKCNRCGSTVRRITTYDIRDGLIYFAINVDCPHCGHKTVITNEHGNWDYGGCGRAIPFPEKGESHDAWVARVKTA